MTVEQRRWHQCRARRRDDGGIVIPRRTRRISTRAQRSLVLASKAVKAKSSSKNPAPDATANSQKTISGSWRLDARPAAHLPRELSLCHM